MSALGNAPQSNDCADYESNYGDAAARLAGR